ncbi:meteorin-like protein [Centropristis striata]|uniref:meteorin-like protein n=1 Tax=Centropristis striata TaxID=184440 RepID=UPI0027E119DE|nr:meteorin-like protein [Centropristis striata]
MRPNVIFVMFILQLQLSAADLCNWTGSRFAAALDSRIVLQVRLRCTEGSVRWIYPGQALRVVLEPNLSSARRTTVCLKPSPSFRGASVFIERAGRLEPLLTEGGGPGGPGQQVFCFRADGPHRPAIYLQSSPQSDGAWSRRTMGFRYQLVGNMSAPTGGHSGLQATCRPCNDTELLMAVCNSDFVVRGSIKNVSSDSERQTSVVEVSAARVYWQRGGVFEQQASLSGSPRSWRGHIHTLLRCHVKPGDGEFLFTGSQHFGEAWLGCAPRYKDFLSVYQAAWAARRNACDFPLD